MKNVVITGTSRGIGFELAKQFANNGHQSNRSAEKPRPRNSSKSVYVNKVHPLNKKAS